MKSIIIDIEGTTTDINFVHKVLFPYAKEKIPNFLNEFKDDEQVLAILESIKSQYFTKNNIELKDILELIFEWIESDKKIKELKELQGFVWKKGYEKGELVAHLYDDVIPNLNKWKSLGIKLYIYSSGSILAQKLLFSHTESGDITDLFDGFFDTNIGSKLETDSYLKILNEISCDADNALFLSDNPKELSAAVMANIKCYHLNRDNLYNDSVYNVIENFDLVEV